MWNIEILTIFPGIFESFLKTSLVAKAITRGLLAVKTTNIRDFSSPPHHKVDDSPYGGGAGMVMMVAISQSDRISEGEATICQSDST